MRTRRWCTGALGRFGGAGAVLGAGGLAVVLAVTTGAARPPADAYVPLPFYGQDIAWSPCFTQAELDAVDADAGGGTPPWMAQLECGTLTVPVDYGSPDGETVGIALARRPAHGPESERRGSLVVDFGGPGVSTVDGMRNPFLGERVQAAFDLVGFDPRGVGRSGGLDCDGSQTWERELERVAPGDPAERTAADLRGLGEAAEAYGRSCAEAVGGEFLSRMGTVNVVRDLDVLRDALGDEGLTYVGYSYGTHVGALYADMFPDRTRALVLDGVVDTAPSNAQLAVEVQEAFQDSWEMVAEHCARTVEGCPFTSGRAAVKETPALLERFDRDRPTVRGRTVTGEMLAEMVATQLYDEWTWDYLAGFFTDLAEGDTGSETYRRYLEYMYDRAFGEEADEGMDAYTAVMCADRDDPEDLRAYREAVEEAELRAPLFGGAPVWATAPCARWPLAETGAQEFTASAAPPIVLVGNVGDPATPYRWAQRMHARLTTSVLVTYEGGGHTVYGRGKSACVDNPLDEYLISGKVPEHGLTCPQVLV
ncbi:alpha/beta hydrolase [Nocardiopsis tropica]|uniref:Alpha/beta hydrolase n=1 Tax=Nocardiopsis tropica TaxID=109330 RepID=A0ABU7KLN0_9ACTN|nr:alpha/beta hydrolase [Nocardiopsis umidischolae]MEE2049904.1 alpha/beta hydrolase [Nocardiopsis umidischolae]